MQNLPFHRFNPLVPLALKDALYRMCDNKAGFERRKQERDKAEGRVSKLVPIKTWMVR